MLWSSWHNHTGDGTRFSYCADADLTPDVYRRMLRTGPWQAFAITEHAFALALPPEKPWPFQWFHHPERLWAEQAFREEKTAKYLERIARVCDGERIYSGIEAEVACDGSFSLDSALWPYLDIVIGSIHYLPGKREQSYTAYIDQLMSLLRYPIDILGHPFRELSHNGSVPDEIIDETLRLVKQAGVAIEINAHMPFERDADVVARAVQCGIQVAFGLDCHSRGELQLYSYFAQVLDASGVAEDAIQLFLPVRRNPKPRV